jgi:hypothetical protein
VSVETIFFNHRPPAPTPEPPDPGLAVLSPPEPVSEPPESGPATEAIEVLCPPALGTPPAAEAAAAAAADAAAAAGGGIRAPGGQAPLRGEQVYSPPACEHTHAYTHKQLPTPTLPFLTPTPPSTIRTFFLLHTCGPRVREGEGRET